MSGMERRLQDCIVFQVQRVEDHLERLEKRLDDVEAMVSSSRTS
jgi:tetrahydromethanopterin S-methyltransferase subunit B